MHEARQVFSGEVERERGKLPLPSRRQLSHAVSERQAVSCDIVVLPLPDLRLFDIAEPIEPRQSDRHESR